MDKSNELQHEKELLRKEQPELYRRFFSASEQR